MSILGEVSQPFQNDEEVHETKECKHHDELWQELKEEVNRLSVVESICTFQEDSKRHVGDTINDSKLHLERVDECDLIS